MRTNENPYGVHNTSFISTCQTKMKTKQKSGTRNNQKNKNQ